MGAPGMLSGGFDLKVMRSGGAAAGKLVTDGGALITRMFGSEMPVLIACTGHAVAAGALLLLGADERIGARGEFRIGLIETEIGMVLPQWAAELARGAPVAASAPDRDRGRQDVRRRRRLRRRLPRPGGGAAPRGAERARGRVPLGEAAPERVPRPGPDERGDVLGRLADAIAVDRGRAFDVPA